MCIFLEFQQHFNFFTQILKFLNQIDTVNLCPLHLVFETELYRQQLGDEAGDDLPVCPEGGDVPPAQDASQSQGRVEAESFAEEVFPLHAHS